MTCESITCMCIVKLSFMNFICNSYSVKNKKNLHTHIMTTTLFVLWWSRHTYIHVHVHTTSMEKHSLACQNEKHTIISAVQYIKESILCTIPGHHSVSAAGGRYGDIAVSSRYGDIAVSSSIHPNGSAKVYTYYMCAGIGLRVAVAGLLRVKFRQEHCRTGEKISSAVLELECSMALTCHDPMIAGCLDRRQSPVTRGMPAGCIIHV